MSCRGWVGGWGGWVGVGVVVVGGGGGDAAGRQRSEQQGRERAWRCAAPLHGCRAPASWQRQLWLQRCQQRERSASAAPLRCINRRLAWLATYTAACARPAPRAGNLRAAQSSSTHQEAGMVGHVHRCLFGPRQVLQALNSTQRAGGGGGGAAAGQVSERAEGACQPGPPNRRLQQSCCSTGKRYC